MPKDQNKTPLLDAVLGYAKRRPAYFCIPAHRYENGIDPQFLAAAGEGIFRMDLTETPLTDDLHEPEGPVKEAQELAAELFGADQSFFLANGSSCGNQAMIMTAACEGQTLAIARNAHKSAFSGLVLSGAKPVYICPQTVPGWGIHGGITTAQVEAVLRENPGCKGVMIVSPTYYGVVSDVRGIAEVCHRYGAVLMVDEAHGAHCYFSGKLPEGALQAGADMCVQSTHKTSGSFTQSSMLHVKSSLADLSLLKANLQMVQSSSPSYLLTASLDAARRNMALNGSAMAERALSLADTARKAVNAVPGLSCMGSGAVGTAGVHALDPTRLCISVAELGIGGFELKQMLFDEYNVDVELADSRNILAIVTYANTEEDIEKLCGALKSIAAQRSGVNTRHRDPEPGSLADSPDPSISNNADNPARLPFTPGDNSASSFSLPGIPPQVLTPRQAYFAEKKRIPWKECAGKISAEMIAPYPPGIPVIYPGERITQEIWDCLEAVRRRGGHMHGPSDKTLDTILVTE